MLIKRGDIYFAELDGTRGSEQGGMRPVLIIQNDLGNKFSPTVIAATITSQQSKRKLPTHIELAAGDGGLHHNSVILLEQIRTIDKVRLKSKIGETSVDMMDRVHMALGISIGFDESVLKSMLKSISSQFSE